MKLLPKVDIAKASGLKTFETKDEQIIHLDSLDEALILIEGEMTVLKNDEACISINPGYILGLKQVLQGIPCHLRCKTRKAKLACLNEEQVKSFLDGRSFDRI